MSAAWTALIIWPLVSIFFFRSMRLPAAVCTTIIGGYLLLPEIIYYDLPILPRLNKASIPILAALVMTMIALAAKPSLFEHTPTFELKGWIPQDKVIILFMGLLVMGTFGTILTNRDPLFVASGGMLPGLRIYDAFSVLLEALIVIVAPILIGRKVLASQEGQFTLLKLLVLWAAFYSLAVLYEVRMSPQFHARIYGFAPQSFFEAMRNGGWRPYVMLRHGLHLAIFMAMTGLAAVALFRFVRVKERMKWAVLAAWLFLVLAVSNSLGALILAIAIAPAVLVLKPRVQILIAACISVVVLIYPAMRNADVVPTDRIVSFAASISAERAQSFEFRVYHEEILLEKARQRPIFGWGGFARNRVVDEFGRDISVTDGAWLIEFGVGGWVRYIAVFGLLTWPSIALLWRRRDSIDPLCGGLALILSAKLLDLIPNGGLVPVIWLLAGSLIGRLEMRDGVADASTEGPFGVKTGARSSFDGGSRDRPVYARRFKKEAEEVATAVDISEEQERKNLSYRREHRS